MGELLLIRHGETTWSARRRHTSYTDLALTPDGERQARALGPMLTGRRFATVLTSPYTRAVRTARLAGLTPTGTDNDLVEWNYGEIEGRTTAEVHEEDPDWNLWTDGCPGGESPSEVGARLDRLLNRLGGVLEHGTVAVVGHAHSLRVLTARWLGLAPSAGALFRLETATVSVLGHEHDRPVILRWNQPAPPAPAAATAQTPRH